MGIAIQGNTGPYDARTPRGYGANTAHRVLEWSQTQPQQLLEADIYLAPTPAGPDPTMGARVAQGAVGYAGEEIRQLGHGKTWLDRADVAAMYGGTAPLADAFVKTRDVNGDGRISVSEEAAHVLFELNPTGFLRETLNGYAQHAPTLYSPQQRQALSQSAEMLARFFPTRLKEYSTPRDRQLADAYALNFPAYTRETLRGVVSALSLDQIA